MIFRQNLKSAGFISSKLIRVHGGFELGYYGDTCNMISNCMLK